MTIPSSARPRVIFIGPAPPPYMGPTLATVVLLNSKLNDEFELIHLDTSDPREIGSLGAIDITNIWLAVKSYFELLCLLIRRRPKLVYIPISQTTLGYLRDSVYIWLSRLLFCKVICHLRGGYFRQWFEHASPLTRFYVQLTHRRVHGQIVLGECLRPLFDGLVPEDRVHVVPNGKDYDLSAAACKSNKPIRVLYLANIIREKGAPIALEACRLIGPDKGVEFHFAGAWEDERIREETQQFLRTHPELPIHWIGPVSGPEKNRLFENADLFIFPTYYAPEGHPWVVVEAMAAGLPVIATDQGAIRESVLDGVNGFLVEKRNPHDLAEKIMRLANDSDLRQRMSRESRKRYLDEFTEGKMVERMACAFRASLSN